MTAAALPPISQSPSPDPPSLVFSNTSATSSDGESLATIDPAFTLATWTAGTVTSFPNYAISPSDPFLSLDELLDATQRVIPISPSGSATTTSDLHTPYEQTSADSWDFIGEGGWPSSFPLSSSPS